MILICAVLFLIGIGVGAASGSSGTPSADTVTVSGTVTTVTTPGAAASLPAKTVTVTAPATTKSSPPENTPKVYTGSGGETIIVFVRRDGYMTWTNDGDIFQIFTKDADVWANSQSHSGRSYIHAGRYEITVNAIGNWKISIP